VTILHKCNPSKTFGRMGGGCQYGRPRTRGGVNRTSRNGKQIAFWGSVLESYTPPSTGVRINIFCVSDVFTCDTVRTSETRGICQTDDVGPEGGGCPKSQFLLGRL